MRFVPAVTADGSVKFLPGIRSNGPKAKVLNALGPLCVWQCFIVDHTFLVCPYHIAGIRDISNAICYTRGSPQSYILHSDLTSHYRIGLSKA